MTLTTNRFWRLNRRALGSTGVALVMLTAPFSATADENDQQPIPKVGTCPTGYRTSGDYCIPLESTDEEVIIKLKSCPSGYRTSGHYCIKLN